MASAVSVILERPREMETPLRKTKTSTDLERPLPAREARAPHRQPRDDQHRCSERSFVRPRDDARCSARASVASFRSSARAGRSSCSSSCRLVPARDRRKTPQVPHWRAHVAGGDRDRRRDDGRADPVLALFVLGAVRPSRPHVLRGAVPRAVRDRVRAAHVPRARGGRDDAGAAAAAARRHPGAVDRHVERFAPDGQAPVQRRDLRRDLASWARADRGRLRDRDHARLGGTADRRGRRSTS